MQTRCGDNFKLAHDPHPNGTVSPLNGVNSCVETVQKRKQTLALAALVAAAFTLSCGIRWPHIDPCIVIPCAEPTPRPTPGRTCGVWRNSGRSDCDCYLADGTTYVACGTPPPRPTATTPPGPTSTPAPTATPTRTPTPALDNPPCAPTPPPTAVNPTMATCPPHLRRLDGTGLCLTDWPCRDPLGRSCHEGAKISFAAGHVQVTRDGDGSGCPPGLVWDGHPGPCTDAWCRPTFDGVNLMPVGAPDTDQPWKRAGVCEPASWPCEAPTPGPTPAPTVAPGQACTLPPGTGDGLDCPRTSPRLLDHVMAAIDRVIADHPDWLEPGVEIVREGQENPFRNAAVVELRAAGFCAIFDGEEIAIKNTNQWSEQYHVLSSARHIRRGEGSYRATCTPAWSAITAGAQPTPEPTPTPDSLDTCPCLVAVTVAFLGINDGQPPELHPGDSITLDTTYRLARWDGDGRGAAAEHIEGRNCVPPRGPEWTVDTPGGVVTRKVNDGYGLRLQDLQAGHYRVSVQPPPNLMGGGDPARSIVLCGWPAGDSVRSTIEFEVQ